MAATKHLAILSALLLAAKAFHAEEATTVRSEIGEKEQDYRLPSYIVPRHYDLKVTPHIVPHNFTFEGEVLIDLDVQNATKKIVLHSKDLTIGENDVVLSGVEPHSSVPTSYDFDYQTEMVTIHFDREIRPGLYKLYLRYSGVLNSKKHGFYPTSYVNDANETVWLVVTDFEPTYARQVFPCMDEPALKSTFDISIKHYPNYTALSNMPVRERSSIDDTDGKLWTSFNTTPVMSTYLVSFLVSDFTNVSNSDGTVNVWCRSNAVPLAEFGFEVARRAVGELQRYTNGSLLVPKLDIALVSELEPAAMENWGLIIYREEEFLYDESSSEPSDKELVATQIVHEVSHQWFGNIVTPSWWSHLWLKEGFAVYLQYYISDKLYPEFRAMDMFVPQLVHQMLSTDFSSLLNIERKVSSLTEISEQYSSVAYRVAPSIIHMLSHCLSEDVFHKGLIYYLQRHKYSTAGPEDLWEALQNAFDESDVPQKKFNVQEVMDSWIKQTGYPVVNVHRNYETGEVTFTQTLFNNARARGDSNVPNKTWWVPINFATSSNVNFTYTYPTLWLTPDAQNVTIDQIDAQDWIIVNIQETGYYRVNYDTANWKKIAAHLNSENYTHVHPLNRAQILNDAYYLLLASHLDPVLFMEITKYLPRETDYVVWYTVFEILENFNAYFREVKAEHIKFYAWGLMDNFINNVGTEHRPGDDYLTIIMREKMLNAACYISHPKCLNAALQKLAAHLKNPELHKIPPYLSQWTFCNGLRSGNESIQLKVVDVYKNDSEKLSQYIPCINNREIIENYLNTIIRDDSNHVDVNRVLLETMENQPENVDLISDFIIHNWKKITARRDYDFLVPEMFWLSYGSDQTEKINVFLKELGLEGSAVVTRMTHTQQILDSYIAKIESWFKSQNRTF